MRRYTQKDIRALIRDGFAHDLDTLPQDNAPKRADLDHIGYSAGTYGCNGGLFEHRETGAWYAFVGRSKTMYLYT